MDKGTSLSSFDILTQLRDSEMLPTLVDFLTFTFGLAIWLYCRNTKSSSVGFLPTTGTVTEKRYKNEASPSPAEAEKNIVDLLRNDFLKAMRIYKSLPFEHLPQDNQFWFILLQACVRVNHAQLATMVLEDMIHLKMKMPTEKHRRTLRYCFCKRYFQFALRFTEMPDFPINDHDCLHTLMKAAFETNSDECWKFADLLFALPSATSKDSVCSLRICVIKGDALRCLRLFEKVFDTFFTIDEKCFTVVLGVLAAANPERAFQLLKDCIAAERVTLSDEGFVSTIKVFGSVKAIHFSVETFKLHKTNAACFALVKACEEAGNVKQLTAVIRDSTCVAELSLPVLTSVIKSLTNAFLITEEADLYTALKENGTPVLSIILLVLKGQCKNVNTEEALQLIESLPSANISMTNETLHHFLEMCVFSGSGAVGKKIWKIFVETPQFQPSQQSCALFVKLLSRCGEVQEILTFLDAQQKEYDSVPLMASFHYFLWSCVYFGQSSMVPELFECMERNNLIPDSKCYHISRSSDIVV